MLRLIRSQKSIFKHRGAAFPNNYSFYLCFFKKAQPFRSCRADYSLTQEALRIPEVSDDVESVFVGNSVKTAPSHTAFPSACDNGLTFDFGIYEDSIHASEIESPKYKTLLEKMEQLEKEGDFLSIVTAFEKHIAICLQLSKKQHVKLVSPKLFRIVLQAYLKLNEPARLWTTVEPLGRLGLKIDLRSLTLVLISCLKNKEWNCVIAIHGARADELGTLCKVIHAVALAHTRAIYDSMQAFRSIFPDTNRQKPTIFAYTLYITELIKLQRLNEVLIVYEAFVEDGYLPVVELVNKILELLLFENRCQQAHILYQKTFKQEKVSPNPLTFVLLVNGFVNKSRPDLAREYLRKMLRLGFTDTTHSCLIWERLFHITLSTAYQDKWESTVALLGYMRDHFPVPSKSHMLSSHLFISRAIAPGKLCVLQKLSPEALLSLLKAVGTVPELPRISRTYLLIAQHLCQVSALHLLPVLIDTMATQEVTVPPHLFGVALNRCFAENNLEMADIIHKRLLSLNIPITRPLYSCIISGLYKVYRSKEAFDMYRAMRNAGHSPILGLAIKLFGLSHKLGDHEFKRWLINDTLDPHGSNGSLTKEEISEFKKVIQSRGCLPKKG